jgi:excisionase family DNA binding protein
MVEARWNRARRGEAFTTPPAGYDRDEEDRWVRSNDEAVQHAVRRVFDKYDELGTARQVFVWWREEGGPFPVRRVEERTHPVVWVPVQYRHIYQMLRHPIYAGVYVFGRSETKRALDAETQRVVIQRTRQRKMKDWPVLIRDHHPAYISFERYLRNQERLHGNAMMSKSDTDESRMSAAREGRALLQGLARCGHCGRRMYVNYGGARAARTLQYRCALPQRRGGAGAECQIVGGKRIEAKVVEVFLGVSAEAGEEAAALAVEQARGENEAVERSWRLQIEKAEYEVQRAERQYTLVEPENRTVARELERRWNARLEELDGLKRQAATAHLERSPLTAAEVERARTLGSDLEAVWKGPTTTIRDRKRLLRALIEDVQISTTEKCHRVRIVWKGDAVTEREVDRVKGGQATATSEDIVETVRTLAKEFDDAQIARILNRQGRRSGRGLAFTAASVCSLRGKNRIPVCERKEPQDEREGPFSADEAARELGVSGSTLHHWLRQGLLAGVQAAPRAPWRIVLTDEVRRRLTVGEAPPEWVSVTEAARRMGVAKSQVVNLVTTGRLRAMRTRVGKRECWRIDLSSAPPRVCPDQATLFDETTKPVPGEA